MKKIIALILALCCVFAVVSCNGDAPEEVDGVKEFTRLYSVSAPTRVETSYTALLGTVPLKGSQTLVTGSLSDGREATQLTYSYYKLQDVASGAGSVITPIIGKDPISGSREYVKGEGERYNGGAWDAAGMNFAPKAGSIAKKLDETKIKDVVYSENGGKKTLSFTVEADNTSDVLGEGYEVLSDVSVVITADSAVITGITISYTADVEAKKGVKYPAAKITMATSYTYGIEIVTLVK